MTPNQKISKTREELNAMADRCRDMAEDLEELADGLPQAAWTELPNPEPLQGFDALSRAIRSGLRPAAGQLVTVTLKNGTETLWRVIDTRTMAKRPETGAAPVVAQLVKILHYRPFSCPTKEHPWGWNDYGESFIRRWLNTALFHQLQDEDAGCVLPREDIQDGRKDLAWLLSVEEAGFGELDRAFEWYACEDEEERDSRRQLRDSDDDPAYWWLRTPSSGVADCVRYVYTDGSLYTSYAVSAYGVAPACMIG